MARIAFIGLGGMGLPMAVNLCKAGHSLNVAVHKNPEPAQKIADLGGVIVGSINEAVRDVDFIISIVPDDTQLKALFFDKALVAGIRPGTTLIEMTSSTPSGMKQVAAALAEHGIDCFDAPVSGGVAGAVNATLTIMGGGSPEVFERVTPILRSMAAKITLAGGIGAGKALKAVNQMLVGINAVATAEAAALGRHLGLDPDIMYDVICASSGASTIFTNKFKAMVNKDYSTGFKASLMRKDIGIAVGEATGTAVPMGALACHIFQMLGTEYDNADYAAIASLYER